VGNGIAPHCARAAGYVIMMNNEVNRIEDREWEKSDKEQGNSHVAQRK
jgi:hypothetical protein